MSRPPKPIDTSTYKGRLGANIRARRSKLGISIEQLCQRLNQHGAEVTVPSVYKYESGQQNIPVDYLPALATALETTVRQILPPS